MALSRTAGGSSHRPWRKDTIALVRLDSVQARAGELTSTACGCSIRPPSSGGSVAFADPDAGVGFGYTTNLWSFRPGEPRASNLAEAVRSCLG